MEWYGIVALVVGIPIVLIPVVFVWYLNVSGLYQVMRDIRLRQKRRAKVMGEREGVAAARTTVGVAERGAE